MLTIKESQLNKLTILKLNDFVLTCCDLLAKEHNELWSTRSKPEWKQYIRLKLEQAQRFGLFEAKNLFVFVLTVASHQRILTEQLPIWATEIMTWPGRSEEDKIFLLCKEVFIQNQEVQQ